MNRQTKQYIKELKAHLKCGRSLRKQVLSDFLPALTSYLEDVPSPTRTMLEDAFGPPQEMAMVLMKSISQEEQISYKRKRKLLRAITIAFATVFVAFSLYVFFDKEFSVITYTNELIPDESILSQEGK